MVSRRESDGETEGVSEGETGNSKLITQHLKLHSTHDIINACKSGKLPDQIMMNFHPQRWTDNPVKWAQELVWQNAKNVVKAGVVRWRSL